jgi:predicted nucleic acid-binding protein
VIVVADTSPLNYLIQLGFDSLLPRLYGHIIVPSAVMQELRHAGAPLEVRAWLMHVPDWVHVNRSASVPDVDLAYLGPGEREAIQLAEERQADLLLIDERKGRLEAKRRGLSTTGTLGILFTAGELKLVDPAAAYRRLLAETTFRTSAALEARFLGKITSRS